jgi:hypothetical protein
MGRVLGLYDHPPADGRVICADEFGPLNLQPRPGRSWQPNGHPARLRATYHRDNGVRHMLAALDLATGKMIYRIRERKRWREFLSCLKALRQHRPTQKLYVIADNFSPHKHPNVRAWAAGNDIEIVFLTTYTSWLNWIESEFAALRYFALNGTDHHSHAEQADAIAGYMRWRNARAQPKRDFAPGRDCRARARAEQQRLTGTALISHSNRAQPRATGRGASRRRTRTTSWWRSTGCRRVS